MGTIEGNTLIAEFMASFGEWRGKKVLENGFKANFTNGNYHCSWDWLMPVVEKIEDIGRDDGEIVTYHPQVKIGKHHCEIVDTFGNMVVYTDESTKIDSVYLAVCEFIKWYNKQK